MSSFLDGNLSQDKALSGNVRINSYNKIINLAKLSYNEGLARARVRDISGAIEELNKSLKLYKYNTNARNLLGLCYFEIGEPVYAMSEWVISKNLQPENNIADNYLTELQKNSSTLNNMKESIKKYNQAVNYIRRGDYDLAKIQLKHLVAKSPGMLRAKGLLALLYLKDNEPKLARKELLKATGIDIGNRDINTYLKEAERVLRGNKSQKKKNNDESSGISYIMNYSRVSIVNMIIGSILGVLVSLFLIFPTITQKYNSDRITRIINTNEENISVENNRAAMEQTIEALNNKLVAYEGKADVKESYEHLISAIIAINDGDLDKASEHFPQISRELLDTTGLEAYDSISDVMGEHILNNNYNKAKKLLEDKNYSDAVTGYLIVLEANEEYNNGNALLELARSYDGLKDEENAIKYYNRVIELFPDSDIAEQASERIAALEEG